MLSLKKSFNAMIKRYCSSESGAVAVEAAMIFPVLLVMFLGTMDLGRGILSNQKTIKASQITADLIARNISVTTADIDEAIEAGELALQPYPTGTLGFDIISFRFLADGTPEIVWRRTSNMTPVTSPELNVLPLSDPGNGVVMVVSQYTYEPIITNVIVDSIAMEEIAFSRGRRSAVVCQTGAVGCS